MDQQKLYHLIDKALAGSATAEEEDLLATYYNSFQQEKDWNKEQLGDVVEIRNRIFAAIENKLGTGETPSLYNISQVQNKKTLSFKRIGIAASLIGLLTLGNFFWITRNHSKEITQKKVNEKTIENEASSKSDNTLLTLGDGSTLCLNRAADGRLINQGNTEITKNGGKLNYRLFSGQNQPVYNTLTTLPGGKFQVQLPDGTFVWLNAASSIRFPTTFPKSERRVELTGEAYFEVSKNKTKPFVVDVGGSEVRVLGTHFNIMSYSNEASLKTTLFEGSVKFVNGTHTNTIKPGEQVQLLNSGQVKILTRVNTDEVLAWKNGMFDFEGDDIETVMRELRRWYEVEVLYAAKINDHFYAKVPRSLSLSKVLRLIELTGKVHFEVNQNRIIVKG